MSGNSEMVERVARAICGGDRYDEDASWEVYVVHARAAIEAMMTPTEAMYLACWPKHHPWGENAPSPNDRRPLYNDMKVEVLKYWQTMLSEALSPSLKEQEDQTP